MNRKPENGSIVPVVVLMAIAFLAGGCSSRYVTPGAAADMSVFGVANTREQLTDYSIRQRLNLPPLATFPTALAVARVQGSGYRSYSGNSYGAGRYSVVTTRETELDEHIGRLTRLPMVTGVAPINRLLLSQDLQTDRELRNAVAQLHADLILIYTLDTSFHKSDVTSPLDVVTLGFLPSKSAKVNCTASAVLLDTRNGYVYGVAEGAADHQQAANAWTSEAACESARKRAEAEAVEQLVAEFERVWGGVVNTYAGGTPVSPARPAAPPGGGHAPGYVPAGTRYRSGG